MATNPEPIPPDPVVIPGAWTVTNSWFDWLLNLATLIVQTARRLKTVALDDQSDSIGATALLAGNPGGRYRVTVFLHITQAASVDSSILATIGFTVGGDACSLSTANLITNTTDSVVSESFLVEHDQAVALTYATTYTSVGGTPMEYSIRVVVESMS